MGRLVDQGLELLLGISFYTLTFSILSHFNERTLIHIAKALGKMESLTIFVFKEAQAVACKLLKHENCYQILFYKQARIPWPDVYIVCPLQRSVYLNQKTKENENVSFSQVC